MIVRAKGEATLAEEARLAAQKKREEMARKLYEKKQADLMAAHNLKNNKEAEDEARKQRIMQMLMGGKKGNSKKFFKAWVIGCALVKKERLSLERKARWMQGCNCPEHHTGPCGVDRMLRDPVFEMPFDALQRTLGSMSGYGGTDSMWRSKSSPQLAASTGPFSFSRPGGGSQALPALGASPGKQAVAGSRAFVLGAATAAAPPPPPPFVDFNISEVVVHQSTGRKCRIDMDNMRMVFDDDKGQRSLV